MHYVRAAKAVIRRKDDGKYLVLRCSEWPERPDRSLKPDLPGGMIEDGESIEEGVTREVHEETALELASTKFVLGYANSNIYEGGDEPEAIIRHIYFAETDSTEITLSYEHDKYWWVTLDEMLALEWKPFYAEALKFMCQSELLG